MSYGQLIAKLKLASDASLIVARALSLIDKPSRWTKFDWALNRRGRPVVVGDAEAARFCLVGAVLRADIDLYQAVIVSDCSQSRRPAVAFASNRVKLVLDVLAVNARERLKELGHLTWIDREDALASVDGMEMRAPDLPAIYNATAHVRHADVFALLLEAGGELIEAAQSPDLADELVDDRRLLDARSGASQVDE